MYVSVDETLEIILNELVFHCKKKPKTINVLGFFCFLLIE
ncbi:hypothetical protein RV17_GL001269 [Enterococcus thailandicus]|nr:hypothetical protein RV17_GL001269 [Enterococcus thailandicus]